MREFTDGLWDFRFSRRRVWSWLSSGLLRRLVWYKFTDVLEVLAASIIRVMSGDRDRKHLWNVGKHYRTTWCNNPEDSHLLTDWLLIETLINTYTFKLNKCCVCQILQHNNLFILSSIKRFQTSTSWKNQSIWIYNSVASQVRHVHFQMSKLCRFCVFLASNEQ
jgi:hypothetical protein